MTNLADIAFGLAAAKERAEISSDQLKRMMNGPAGVEVETDTGPVPTVKEFLRRNQEAIDEAKPENIIDDVQPQPLKVFSSEKVATTVQQVRDDLADPEKGAEEVGFDSITAADVMDQARPMQSYTALRSYAGRAKGVRITTPGISGLFQRDEDDGETPDNGGTVVVDALGRRWKREFSGAVSIRWFGAKGNGVADDTSAVQAAADCCAQTASPLYAPPGTYPCVSLNITNVPLLHGDGRASRFVQLPDAGPGQELIWALDSVVPQFVYGLLLDGQYVGATDGVLLSFRRGSSIYISDVHGYKAPGASIRVGGGSTYTCKNVFISECSVIEGGRQAGFNRNGIELFKCQNLVVDTCYVKGSGFTPNNVGLMIQGCQYFSVNNCVLEDNGSEQIQLIGTDWNVEQAPDSENRTKFGSITNCTVRHTTGHSNTTNVTIGENASDIVVQNCVIDGGFKAGITLFRWTHNINISNNVIRNAGASAVSINDATGGAATTYPWGNIVVRANLLSMNKGPSAIVVASTNHSRPYVVLADNVIEGINAGGGATVTRVFEITGVQSGNVTIKGNTCVGPYQYAIDYTGASLAWPMYIHDNNFSGYTVAAARASIRGNVFAWNNIEPDLEAPQLYRAKYDFDLAAGANTTKIFNAAESSGALSFLLKINSGTGRVFLQEGVLIDGNGKPNKIIKVKEDGGGPVTGSVYIFAKPTS